VELSALNVVLFENCSRKRPKTITFFTIYVSFAGVEKDREPHDCERLGTAVETDLHREM